MVGLSGCVGGRLNFSDRPRLTWELDWQSYLSAENQHTLWTWGTATNVSDVYIEFARLDISILDSTDDVIDSATARFESLDAGETQQYHIRYQLSADQMRNVDDADVDVYIEGEPAQNN